MRNISTSIIFEYAGFTFDFDVYINYTPAEPMVMYYSDGSGSPEYPAEIELVEIVDNDKGLLVDPKKYKNIYSAVDEYINNNMYDELEKMYEDVDFWSADFDED